MSAPTIRTLMDQIIDYGDSIRKGEPLDRQLAHIEAIRDSLEELSRDHSLAEVHDSAHFLPGHRRERTTR
jgi:hypothetical protein